MRIVLVAIGERMPGWVRAGFDEYARRLPRELRLELHEVRAGRRTQGADIARVLADEGERLLAAVPAGARAVALERTGRMLATEELARELDAQLARGQDLALLAGGPEGFAPGCLARLPERWSLSRLTFAHPLVRVVVAEQVYRAWSILKQLPYHR